MPGSEVLVVVEIVSVQDPERLKTYAERAGALIGAAGGEMLGIGGHAFDEEAGFNPLVIERWPSEDAFRAWMASEAYRPLRELRRASATMRAAIVPIGAGLRAA